jgi:hypothetical protein
MSALTKIKLEQIQLMHKSVYQATRRSVALRFLKKTYNEMQKQKFHKTHCGTQIPIKEMEDDHIINAIKSYEKSAKVKAFKDEVEDWTDCLPPAYHDLMTEAFDRELF